MPGHSQVLIRTLPLLMALGVVAVCCRTVQADTRSEARIQVTLKIPPWVRVRVRLRPSPAQPASHSVNADSYCFYRAPGSPYSLSVSDSEGSPVEAVNADSGNDLCDSPQAQTLSFDNPRDAGQNAQLLTLMVQSE